MKYLLSHTSIYFPKQIKLIRENLNMSSYSFATFCSLTHTTVRRMEIENSGCFVTKRTWNKINMALNKVKYFERDNLPHIEIKNKITYAYEQKTVQKIEFTNPKVNQPIKTFWQPIYPHSQFVN